MCYVRAFIHAITDFGLTTVRALPANTSKDVDCSAELLWTAPELLIGVMCLDNVGRGTPAGDVYSFAVLWL